VKYFIIGSNSFSGSGFINYLLDNNEKVTGISRSAESNQVFLSYKKNKNINYFQFHQLDLNIHLEEIIALIENIQPDYIINFAAQSMVAESWIYPEQWFMTNVVSNVKLHDKLRKMNFLKKYIHISTPEVYGPCQDFIKENTNYNPSTPYAVSRAACDLSLMSFYNNYNFPVVFTRAANVFGPGQQLYRIIPRTILFILQGKKLSLHGGGKSVRSFIHINDVSSAVYKICLQAAPGSIYHLSTKRTVSIRELVEIICKIMGADFNEIAEVSTERPGKDLAYLLDSEKSRTELNWQDIISLESGIEETIKWIKNNFEEIKKQPFEYKHKP
jgi:dTDP-glucose 4,6-dehydratase